MAKDRLPFEARGGVNEILPANPVTVFREDGIRVRYIRYGRCEGETEYFV